MGFDRNNPPISFLVRRVERISNHIFEEIAREEGLDEVTMTHGRILGFLYDHRGEDVFQKDLEAQGCINRSSVTSVIQTLEKKGYIERMSMESDARLKKVVLTEMGEQRHLACIKCLHKMDQVLSNTISSTEEEQLRQILIKMTEGLSEERRMDS